MRSRIPLRPSGGWAGSAWLDALIPAGLAAIVLAALHAAPLAVFVLAAAGLIPLAAVLGRSTDVLSARVGPLAAGLLQGAMGNAGELILGLVALRAGLVTVVQASLAGSIISNLLMVLGLSILVGGWNRARQTINRSIAGANIAMLFLAAVGLIVPAVFSLSVLGRLGGASRAPALMSLSLWTAGILIVIYGVSLSYQLRTGRRTRAAPADPAAAAPRPSSEPPHATRWAIATMLVVVVLIAILSELLVGELQTAKLAFHGTDLFWGGIVFALIGNAAEHAVAIGAAHQGEMDLAMAIGVGSSLQIALLLAPVLVFVSLLLGHPMTLVFGAVELVAVILSVVMVALIVQDGETNWLEGAQLLAVYAILVAAFYFFPA